jgi:hypothetical protein
VKHYCTIFHLSQFAFEAISPTGSDLLTHTRNIMVSLPAYNGLMIGVLPIISLVAGATVAWSCSQHCILYNVKPQLHHCQLSIARAVLGLISSVKTAEPEAMRASNDILYPFRLQSQASNSSPSNVFGTIFSDNFQRLDVPNRRCPAGLATKHFIRVVSGLSSPSQHNLASYAL